jgi:hypothetical protein
MKVIRGFPVVLIGLAAINSVLFFYFAERASIRVPVYDLMVWLQFYGDHMHGHDWLSYLWTPHNEHRIVLSRALLALDVKWFGSSGNAFVLSGLLLLIVMIIALSREIIKSDMSLEWKLSAIPLSILLLMPAHEVVTLGMPAMSPYLQTCAFAMLALAMLDGPAHGDRLWLFRGLSVAAACISAFGVSSGLLIWPAMLWSVWRGNLSFRWIATLACLGGLFIAIYLHDLQTVSGAFYSIQLVRRFDYLIRFLGLPWSHLHALVWPGRGIGLGVLAFGGFALVGESMARRPSSRIRRFGLALVLFSFLVAASAALARVDVAEDREMPIRYGMFVVLAHLGLLLWVVDILQRWRHHTQQPVYWLIIGLSIVWLGQQVVAGEYAITEADRYKNAWSRFVAGEWAPDMLHYVYPDQRGAEAGVMNLRRMGLDLYGSK